ncbi:M48 family peptidase [Methylolobus aquaticus]|nr:M48 family peptidase [Methylolobus aquaticus]
MKRLTHPILSLAIGASTLTACATNPITGRSQAALVSDAEAAKSSQQAYSQLVAEAHRERALDTDPATLSRVRTITDKLVVQAQNLRPETRSWRWEVHVLRVNEINAWCMAGGKMAVYTGLLDKIKPTDDELAQVMAHEISHALLSHQAEKMSRVTMQKAGLQLGMIAGAIAGYNLGTVAGLADSAATLALQLPNSREAESEADAVGMQLAARAGYNPQAAVSLWEKMLHASGSRTPEILSTHPSPETRIDAMRKLAEKYMPVYQQALHGRG